MPCSVETRNSPNRDSRNGAPVDILLLHYTGMVSAEAALDRLCDPAAKVSCHWFVHRDGRIVRMVPESDRAWHAGVSNWAGATNINARSIGIEIDNPGHAFGYCDFPDVQIGSLIALCGDVLGRHPIPPERVLAHSDVAPSRKSDPGELFPWARLAAAGIGHWVSPVPADPVGGSWSHDIGSFQAQLASYGYGIAATGAYDQATKQVVTAFQRHFRPERIDGLADAATRETLDRLVAALRRD